MRIDQAAALDDHAKLPAMMQVLGDDEGRLGSVVPSSKLYVPRNIQLEDARLAYSALIDPPSQRGRTVEPDAHVLDDFLKLRDASGAPDNDVAAFAKKWGPLYLCESHDLPVGHPPLMSETLGAPVKDFDQRLEKFIETGKFDEMPGGRVTRCWEPHRYGDKGDLRYSEAIAGWRSLARAAFQTLWVAVSLSKPRLKAERPEWPELPHYWDERQQLRHFGLGRREPIARLASCLDWWLWTANVRPVVQITTSVRVAVNFAANDTFRAAPPSRRLHDKRSTPVAYANSRLAAVIGMQLLAAVTGGGIKVCEACGQPFLALRTRRKYCAQCGRGAALRAASARYYAKIRRKRHPMKRRACKQPQMIEERHV